MAFVDLPPAGVAKIREIISSVRFQRHEMGIVAAALGASRCEFARRLPTFFRVFRQAPANGVVQCRRGHGLDATDRRGLFLEGKSQLSVASAILARWPVSISYNTAPNEKMSLRPSSSLPSTCSGDM